MNVITKINKLIKRIPASVLGRLIIIAIIGLVFRVISKNYLSFQNIVNIITDMTPYFIMGMGITFVLLIGSIDLSTGALCSVVACLVAKLLPNFGALAFIFGLCLGVAGGFITGLLVAKVKIPSFIATLGMMGIWTTLAYIISNSVSIVITKQNWMYINWASTYVWVMPLSFILAILLWVALYQVEKSTAFGKGVYAVGVNETAASVAGVNVFKIKTLAFVLCGLLSALAGIVIVANFKGSTPIIGNSMNMKSIAMVVLGGTFLTGGKGGILSALLGSAIIMMIQNGLNLIGVVAYHQDIAFGILLIITIFVVSDKRDRRSYVK